MIEELVRRAAADDDDAAEELDGVADEPGALAPYQHLMLDLGLLWPPKLFRAADAGVVERMVAEVDGGRVPGALNHLLLALAHTRHPLAEQAFLRWAEAPPPGSGELHVGPLAYALAGGWTIGPDGRRRDVCGDVAFQWILRETSPRTDGRTCPWCASPLWTAADLDTADGAVGAALAHTGWKGRLVIETCHFCSCYGTLFCQVTPDGGVEWWPGTPRPDHLGRGDGPEDPPWLLPVPGDARSTPFQASAWDRGGSTLGGSPEWIQDADHVTCPACGQPMDYVGMIYGGDLDEYGEGVHYLHLHQPCNLAAVNYQQS